MKTPQAKPSLPQSSTALTEAGKPRKRKAYAANKLPHAYTPNRLDVGKALKLRLQGNTLSEIGKVFGVTDSAVHHALKNFEPFIKGIQSGDLSAYAEEKSNILNAVEQRLMASLMDEGALQKASLRDRTIAFGTVYDKGRLERGKSTENVAVLSKIIDAAHDSMRKPLQVVVEPVTSEVAKVESEENQ